MTPPPLPYKIAALCDLRDRAGRVLLIHRAKAPNKGLYSPIGGKLDMATGESPAQCARREIQEEAGIDVALERLRLIGMVSETGYEQETHWLMFVYRVVGAVEVTEQEIREGRLEWKRPEELDQLPTPETDRHVLWPLIMRSCGRFFAVHIDCTGDKLRWTLEQDS